MITKPDNFAEYCYRSGEQLHWVVEIQNKDSDVWYFSDIGMDVDEGQVLQLLLEPPKISEQMDVFTKRWGVPQCSVVISNLPVLVNSDGTKSRFSDVMGDTANRTMKIYAVAGPTCGSLADDALLRFSGIVLDTPGYDADTMQVRGISGLSRYNQKLPELIMGDEHSDCPDDVANKPIPILYGDWGSGYHGASPYSGPGFARGYRLSGSDNPKYLAAGHECDDITELAIPVGHDDGDIPFFAQSVTGTADDTEGATIRWDFETSGPDEGRYALMYKVHLKTSGFPGLYDHETPIGSNAIDGNITTYAVIKDNHVDDGAYCAGLYNAATSSAAVLSRMWASARYDGEPVEAYVRYYDLESLIAGAYVEFILLIGDTEYANWGEFFDSPTMDSAAWEWVGPLIRGDVSTDDEARHWPLMLAIQGVHATAGSGTVLDQDIVNIHEMEMYLRVPVGMPPSTVFVACAGRLYGSWIDGRSSDYTEGDLIEEPGGIIESILRDELSMTDDQIDMPSFIDCEYDGIKHHVHITEERGAFEIIRKICEQSHFALCFTALGKVRIADLRHNASRSADATIPASHIINIDVSRTKVHSTRAEVRARYLPEQGDYYDRVSWWAIAPAARYGLVAYKLDLDYCLDEGPIGFSGSAFNLCSHLFGPRGTYTTPGLLSNKKTQITVTTAGMTHIDIELGDAISIDPDMDNILLCNGATWDSRTFIVAEIRVDGDACTITAVDIDEGM